jgi:hypothetical protein
MKINELNEAGLLGAIGQGLARGAADAVAPGAFDALKKKKSDYEKARERNTAAGGTIFPNKDNPNSYVHIGNANNPNYAKNMAAAQAQDIAAGRIEDPNKPKTAPQPGLAGTAFGQYAQQANTAPTTGTVKPTKGKVLKFTPVNTTANTANTAQQTTTTTQQPAASLAIADPNLNPAAQPATKVAKPKVSYEMVAVSKLTPEQRQELKRQIQAKLQGATK